MERLALGPRRLSQLYHQSLCKAQQVKCWCQAPHDLVFPQQFGLLKSNFMRQRGRGARSVKYDSQVFTGPSKILTLTPLKR